MDNQGKCHLIASVPWVGEHAVTSRSRQVTRCLKSLSNMRAANRTGRECNAKQIYQKLNTLSTPYRRSGMENAAFRLTRAESILPVSSRVAQ